MIKGFTFFHASSVDVRLTACEILYISQWSVAFSSRQQCIRFDPIWWFMQKIHIYKWHTFFSGVRTDSHKETTPPLLSLTGAEATPPSRRLIVTDTTPPLLLLMSTKAQEDMPPLLLLAAQRPHFLCCYWQSQRSLVSVNNRQRIFDFLLLFLNGAFLFIAAVTNCNTTTQQVP